MKMPPNITKIHSASEIQATSRPAAGGSELDGAKLDADLCFPAGIRQALTQWRNGFPVTAIEGSGRAGHSRHGSRRITCEVVL
jgi:hypothetical protein